MRTSTLIKNLRENKNFPILESYFQTWAINGELSQTELRNLIDVYTNIILTVNRKGEVWDWEQEVAIEETGKEESSTIMCINFA